ncbi:S8 family serine peptidase [Streptomyces sp. NPDC003023]|uniref:S8 family serine peptidase n=1 Tax=Streptomyces sp. NPDC003023 TaxID=3364675 RepID=UPI00369A50D7
MARGHRRWRTGLGAAPPAVLAALALLLAGTTPVHARPVNTPEPPASAVASAADDAAAEEVDGAARYSAGLYLVRLAEAPLASYEGGTAGLDPTAPSKGAKLDTRSAASRAYRAHLSKQRAAVLANVPDIKPLHVYDTAFNGFAAKLTARQATELAAARGVASLEPNTLLEADTATTPDFLGLSGRHGVWKKEFKGEEHAGEGVIVGVIDSGFVPEHRLFAPLPEPRPDAALVAKKWNGTCDRGIEAQVACNNKVIGARYFHAGVNPVDAEYLSPRDFDGHGTHTASTAVGDHGVTATVDDRPMGTVSGMAPAARLAVYKTCWVVRAGGGCASVDAVAAVNQAVADGVDVINYSISGSTTSVTNSVETAFFNAAKAGVVVVTSAGNNGGSANPSVAHNAPWTMTVAASTHPRAWRATLTLGDGGTYTGAGSGEAVPSAPLVDSNDAGRAGADPAELDLCFPGTLDPVKVKGRIVLCKRLTGSRVEKSRAVKEAGGIGMVLRNAETGSLNADNHLVPTIHISDTDGAAVRAYASGAAPTARMGAGQQYTQTAPVMGAFSSYGPAPAGDGDLLKPDITGPGVDVLAGVSRDSYYGRDFDLLSGTSMSAPHLAGVVALLRAKHPRWSPAAVKSALMTTAAQTDSSGAPIQRNGRDATPFDYGSGHVVPASAFDPGLVYDTGADQWVRYVCAIGQQPPTTDGSDGCAGIDEADPSDLNYPSIAVGDLPGSQTVTRTVTNVGKRAVYRASVQAPQGFTATVSPGTLDLRSGESATYRVTLTRTDAPLDTYAFGSLVWSSVHHSVRSPIAVKAVAAKVPATAAGTGTQGRTDVPVQVGYNGTLNSVVNGLAASAPQTFELNAAGSQPFDRDRPTASDHTAAYSFTVPAGTERFRFATFAADYADSTDVNLYLYRKGSDGTLTLSASSSGSSSEGWVQIRSPKAGSAYVLYVDLASAPGSSAAVRVEKFVLDGSATGNATATPASAAVKTGDTVRVSLGWQGLAPGTRYLGTVSCDDGTNALGTITAVVSTR